VVVRACVGDGWDIIFNLDSWPIPLTEDLAPRLGKVHHTDDHLVHRRD